MSNLRIAAGTKSREPVGAPEPFGQIVLDALPGLLAEGRRRAADLDRSVLVSLAQGLQHSPDPVGLFSAAGRIPGPRSFWASPTDGTWLVGVGQAAEVRVNGPKRFPRAADMCRDILDSAITADTSNGGTGPIFMGGFRFDAQSPSGGQWREFPDGLLTVPKWTLWHKGGNSYFIVGVVVDGRTDTNALFVELSSQAARLLGHENGFLRPVSVSALGGSGSARWRRCVEAALKAIRDGELTKVALARTLRIRSARPLSPEAVIARLLSSYPECRVFAFSRHDTCFLGATPEELVRFQGASVASTCMAGSARRGATDSEDSMLATGLLTSDKERREHSLVADWVAQRMARLCQSLDWNDAPGVVKLGNVQHLATRFSGVPREGTNVLDFVATLHPTPAVAGIPLGPALRTIRRLEACNRGWYAGPVGWTDGRNGDFAVAIRSALLGRNEAVLYAGAGIVAGSDPEDEYLETEIKFRPLLEALGVE